MAPAEHGTMVSMPYRETVAGTEPEDYIESLFLQPKMDGITMSQPVAFETWRL